MGFLHAKWRRITFALFIPVIGFATIFILISGEMNIYARFQYPILPILLMSVFPSYEILNQSYDIKLLNNRLKIPITIYIIFGILMFTMFYSNRVFYRDAHVHDGLKDVGLILSKYRDKNYWLATTEAGLVPFYSRWHTIDTWGLNDRWIAHHGMVTEEYLDRYKPHVIMFHAYFSPLAPDPKANKIFFVYRDRWDEMVLILKKYAESRGYTLAAVYGETPYDTLYFYVRNDCLDFQNIVKDIKSIKHIWGKYGRQRIDFTDFTPQLVEQRLPPTSDTK